MVAPAVSKGWRSLDVDKIEDAIAKNVGKCYKSLVSAKVKDLDDDTTYSVGFDNMKKLYTLAIDGNDDAELEPSQYIDFFHSDFMKRFGKTAESRSKLALKAYNDIVKTHLDNSELLNVNEIQIEAVASMLSDPEVTRNIRTCNFTR